MRVCLFSCFAFVGTSGFPKVHHIHPIQVEDLFPWLVCMHWDRLVGALIGFGFWFHVSIYGGSWNKVYC